MQLGRYEEAAGILAEILATDPDDGRSHCLLAVASSELERHDVAAEHARRAVQIAPDEGFPSYVLGLVELARGRLDEALEAARRALHLDPHQSSFFGLVARIHIGRKRWTDTLAAADEGLALDPEDDDCANARAFALINLGRREDAAATLRDQLARTPQDSLTHANMGWTSLHRRDYAAAEMHFREALRLDPMNEWARRGIRQALEARHWFYRPVLAFFLWISRFRGRRQAAIIIGGWFLYRVAIGVTKLGGPLALLAWLAVAAYLLFVIGTWFAEPIAAGLLSLHRLGTLALTRSERWTARVLCLGVVLGFGSVALGQAFDLDVLTPCGFTLLLTSASAVLASRVPAGRPRKLMLAYTAGIAALGGWWVWSIHSTSVDSQTYEPLIARATELEERRNELINEHDEARRRGDDKAVAALTARGEELGETMKQFGRENASSLKELGTLAKRRTKIGTLGLVITVLALGVSQVVAHSLTRRAKRH